MAPFIEQERGWHALETGKGMQNMLKDPKHLFFKRKNVY